MSLLACFDGNCLVSIEHFQVALLRSLAVLSK